MLTFNGKKAPEFVKVQAVNIQVLPTVETNLKSIAGSSGRLAGRSSFGEKLISCDIIIVIPENYTLQKCARELAVWLRGDDFKVSPLIITDDTEVRYMAKVNNSAELSDLLVAGQGTIEFVVPSGDSERVNTTTVSGTGSVTANNQGTKVTYPVIEVTLGTAVNGGAVNITNNTTGSKVTLNGTFEVGEVLTVDCNKHLVKRGDSLDISMLNIESQFFGLKEGNNVIQCNNNGTTITVTYREKFL